MHGPTYFESDVSYICKMLMKSTPGVKYNKSLCLISFTIKLNKPGVDLIKLFWLNFTYSFWKLDLFIEMQQIYLIFIKWYSLQKRVSKFTPKKFYEIDPRLFNSVKHYHPSLIIGSLVGACLSGAFLYSTWLSRILSLSSKTIN
jgi:hypothetical protein